MPDKPLLLHIATSLESNLFIAIFNTIHSGFFSSSSLHPLRFRICLQTKSTIHIHSNMFCVFVCVHCTCITAYYFNFTFPNQRMANASSKCVLFLSHLPSNRLTFLLLSVYISILSPFCRYVSESDVRELLWYHLIELCWYIDYHCDVLFV